MRAYCLGLCQVTLCLLSVMALAACDLNDIIPQDARTFEIPADSSVEVPGSFTVGQSPLAPEEVLPIDMGSILSQQLASEFSTQDIQKEAVGSMMVTAMTVTVRDAVENGTQVRDLGFLQSADFFLAAGDLEPVSVAFSADGAFDDNPAEYDFELTDAELVDVLNAGESMAMTADIVPDGRPNFGTTLDFHVVLTVIVDAQGAVESQ